MKRYFQDRFKAFAAEKPAQCIVAGLVCEGRLVDIFHKSDIELDSIILADELRFPIASMTKVFAATTIYQLRDRGLLALDSTVAELLPDLRQSPWNSITVRQLLHMNSGLPYDNPWGDRLLNYDNASIDALLAQGVLSAATPGTEYHYSNLGYVVLGKIVEHVSGSDSLTYMRENVLTPLGMSSTDWMHSGQPYCNGYTKEQDRWVLVPAEVTRGYAGYFVGLVSSLADLAKWIQFMQAPLFGGGTENDSVLSTASRLELQTPVIHIPDTRASGISRLQYQYAAGLIQYTSNAGVSFGHSGGIPGYGSHFRWSKQRQLGMICLTNATYVSGVAACIDALDECVNRVIAQERPIPELVELRAVQLRDFLQSDAYEKIPPIFSSNFFLDTIPADFQQQLAEHRDAFRSNSEVTILGESGLAASLIFSNVELFFTLSPGEGGRIQEILFR